MSDSKLQTAEASSGPNDPVPVPGFYTPEQVWKTLGVSETSYYVKLTKADERGRRLLEFSKLWPGGPRIHTQEQIDAYRAYLNGAGAIANVANREQMLAEAESGNVTAIADRARKRA